MKGREQRDKMIGFNYHIFVYTTTKFKSKTIQLKHESDKRDLSKFKFKNFEL